MNAGIASFAKRHWQGRVALLPTCLVTCLALRIAADALTGQRPPGLPFAAALGVSGLSLALLLWQLTGGARAVARAGHDLFASAAGGLAVLVTALLFLLSEIDTWSLRALPPPDLPEPPKPYAVVDGTVRIAGDIDFHALNRLDAAAAAGARISVIELESPGGRIPAARAIAKRVIEHGWATRATGLCASACTLIFAAGSTRSLAPGGRLAFHGYRIGIYDSALRSLGDEEARDRAYLETRGIAPEFIARAFATPHEALWFPSPEELRTAGWLEDQAASP